MSESDPDTEASGRSLQRRLGQSAIGYSLARGVGFLSMLLVLPAVAHTYGLAGLGLYAAVSSINVFLSALDSGLGAAVRTAIAQLHAQGDERAALAVLGDIRRNSRRWTAVAIVIAVALAAGIPWESILNDPALPTDGAAMRLTIAAFATVYLIGVQQLLNMRVLEGLGRNGAAARFMFTGPVVVLVGTLVLCRFEAPLPLTILLPALSPLIIGLFARWSVGRLAVTRDVRAAGNHLPSQLLNVRVALPMTAIAVGYALSYNLDYWVITFLLGPAATGAYAAAARPAQFMLVVAAAAAPVLWTHFVRARTIASDADLSSRAIARLSGVFVIAGLVTALGYTVTVVLLGSALTAGQAAPSLGLILAFALWGALMIGHQPLAAMLTTARDLQYQMVSVALMTVLNVGLSLALVPQIGSTGAVLASCIALGLVHVPLLYLRCRHHWKNAPFAQVEMSDVDDGENASPSAELESGAARQGRDRNSEAGP